MSQSIIIIGSGTAGLCLAALLGNSNTRIKIVEQKSLSALENYPEDGKEIAVNHLSKSILQKLDIWDNINPQHVSPILAAKVVDQKASDALNIQPKKNKALGYLVPNHILQNNLYKIAKNQPNVEWLTNTCVEDIQVHHEKTSVHLKNQPTLHCNLVVGADGSRSITREKTGIPVCTKNFARTALVCHMSCEKPHHNTAYECFQYNQTLAVLPLKHQTTSVIITIPNDRLPAFLEMTEDEFSAHVEIHFNHQLGKMHLQDQPKIYPLHACYAEQFIAQRTAIIGDAAVTIHPVTAHGFNLGLESAQHLANNIENNLLKRRDIGMYDHLLSYHRNHYKNTKLLYEGTNMVVHLFTKNTPLFKIARRVVLKTANRLTPLKNAIIQQVTSNV